MQHAYAELHAHSCWSLREGASSPDQLVARAQKLGYRAMALTDHDNLYGAMEYATHARERGFQPIPGCELTIGHGMPDDSLEAQTHLTVLAENAEGYRNLCRLLSRAYKVHGKDSPWVEEDWLFEHRDGLIVLSGCRYGELSRLVSRESFREAEALAGWYRDALGPERFFVELQHHDVYGDTQRVAGLAALAERTGLDVVATNNVHYHVRERHRLNDVLVAIRHRKTLDTSHVERRPNSEFFLKHPDAMAQRFAAHPDAIANTLAIAERCQFDLTQIRELSYRLPAYPVPDGKSPEDALRDICEQAFRRKYSPFDSQHDHADARKRLDRELALIEKHGLAGFFLIYRSIMEMVGEIAYELHGRPLNLPPEEQPVGRGRGSSVSSIVCYLIGLSHIDPVKNKLFSERFLNEELDSLPDIDIDFPRDIRDELLKRVYERFGEEHAAIVASFPTYQFRSAILDIGKALGLPAPTLAKLSKLGEAYAGAEEVGREMRRIPELRPFVKAPIWRDLVSLASQVSGFPRHISQHVGGVVISAEPLSSLVPLEPARMEGRYVCQWDKDSIDDARMVKIDCLALGMLSAVDECLDIVEEINGKRPDLGRVPHDDEEIFASIQAGDTMGTFQIESRAQIQSLPRTQPRTIDDLAVQVAIIRPGPIVAGAFRPFMQYREQEARGEPVTIDYGHPELEPYLREHLAETLGHILYQDQVIQTAQAVAGFSVGQADKLRRAMTRKRSGEAIQDLAEPFFEGARRNGVSREAAEVAFKRMSGFASYGFPKSHAVAFALLAYESAWLRYNYPAAFYCALFNAQPMGFYSIEVLSGDCRRHGIEVHSPEINVSRAYTWPEGDGIRLGLEQIKGLGGGWRSRETRAVRKGSQKDPTAMRGVTSRIAAERELNGPYRSLSDLVTRAQLRPQEAEALIRADALRSFGLSRRELLWQLRLLVPGQLQRPSSAGSDVSRPKKPVAYQPALPLPLEQDMVELPSLSEWQEVAWDYAALDTTARPHPMALVRPLLHEGVVTSRHIGGVGNDNRLPHGMTVEVAGMVVSRQRPSTASGLMFLLLEDEFGLINVVVYSHLIESQRELVRAESFVRVLGRVDNEKSGFPHIIAERFSPCPLPGLIEAPQAHNFR